MSLVLIYAAPFTQRANFDWEKPTAKKKKTPADIWMWKTEASTGAPSATRATHCTSGGGVGGQKNNILTMSTLSAGANESRCERNCINYRWSGNWRREGLPSGRTRGSKKGTRHPLREPLGVTWTPEPGLWVCHSPADGHLPECEVTLGRPQWPLVSLASFASKRTKIGLIVSHLFYICRDRNSHSWPEGFLTTSRTDRLMKLHL